MNKKLTKTIVSLSLLFLFFSLTSLRTQAYTIQWYSEIQQDKEYFWKVIEFDFNGTDPDIGLETGWKLKAESMIVDLSTEIQIFDYMAGVNPSNVSTELSSTQIDNFMLLLGKGGARYLVSPLKEDGVNYFDELEQDYLQNKETLEGWGDYANVERTKTTLTYDAEYEFAGTVITHVKINTKSGFLLEYRYSEEGIDGYTIELKDLNDMDISPFNYLHLLLSFLVLGALNYALKRKKK